MAVVYHEIYLPIDTESTFDYIVIKQGDAGTHRVRATLISNNRVYTIPTSGASYFMKFRKPDNNYCLVEATVSDNTISAEVTEEMLRVSGTGRGEFMIVSGSEELKTATFHVKIVRETFTSGDVQSHSDFAPFAALLQGAGAAASNANTAAAAANAAASLAEQKAQAIPDDYSDLVAEVAGKADQSNTYTKDQVDGLIEDVTVETDTTLTVSGAPADAAETGRQFGLIKADLGDAVSYDTAQEKKYSERTTGRKNIGALSNHLGAVNAGQVFSVDENGHAVLQKIGISPECNDALFNLLSSIEYHNNDGVERRNDFMAHFADKKIELPSAYQQVLYLEATGTQYIATNILSQIPFECDVEFYTDDLNPAVVGTADSSVSNARFFLCGVIHSQVGGVNTTKFTITHRFGDGKWNYNSDIWIEEAGKYHVHSAIEYSASGVKSYIKFGDQYSSMDIASAPALGYPICFFLQRNSGDCFAGLLFSAKFTKSGVVLFNGVPCYRKSDGKPGLYDLVSGTFLTNAGTGEFLYGSEI